MSHAAVLLRETAIADIRRRGRTRHPYTNAHNREPIAAIAALAEKPIRDAWDRIVSQLSSRTPAGRELSTISARAGLTSVLTLIARGYRQIGHAEVAAIAGVSLRTADTALAELVAAGILWTPAVGRKGVSMTTWALADRAVTLLVEALDKIKAWAKALRDAVFRARRGQYAKTDRQHTPTGSKGSVRRQPPPSPPPIGVIRASTECPHGVLIPPDRHPTDRCPLCRRAMLSATHPER